jgi:hypothetical protein
VDRDAYVVCVLEQLYRALNRRDVFASPSNRWSDPRAWLLDGNQWEAVAEDVLHGLSLEQPVEEHFADRVRALDAAWQLMAERLEEAGQDAKLSFEIQPNGRPKLNVDRLGSVGEPKSLRWLRKTTAAMLPKIDLPDLLFEVDEWTGFLDAFVHLGDGRTRMDNLKTSLLALLVAEACNIGYTPVIMVFGLFSMLGYNFSPRFNDLADQRFWRAEKPGIATGGYGPLEALAQNRVNWAR